GVQEGGRRRRGEAQPRPAGGGVGGGARRADERGEEGAVTRPNVVRPRTNVPVSCGHITNPETAVNPTDPPATTPTQPQYEFDETQNKVIDDLSTSIAWV